MLISVLITTMLVFPNQQINSNYQNYNTADLVINADRVDYKNTPPIVKGNQVLLPMNVVKKYVDPNLFWDEKMHRAVVTTKDKVVKMNINSNKVLVNNQLQLCSMPVKSIKNDIYIPITFLKSIYGIDIKFNNYSDTIIIDSNQQTQKSARIAQLLSLLRKDKSASSPIAQVLKFNDRLEVFDTYKGWYKVRSDKGTIGFIDAKFVRLDSDNNSKLKLISNSSNAKKLSMAWDQMLNIQGIKKNDALQILSPFWLYISDKNGTIESKASIDNMKSYVDKAHQAGYKVWALFSNSFSPDISSSILNDGALREKVINQITAYAKTYNIDGINIDFENMRQKDKDMFTQFVRELAPMLRSQGKVISTDISAPSGSGSNWVYLDPEALSEAVDYVALMTYDQHWSNCPYSGSVAQYSWVEDKLQATLEEVPSEKLLLGIPFYTRGWKEELDDSGSTKVTQYAVFSMQEARREAHANNADIVWDDQSGQYYAQFSKNNAVYKIWLENEESVNLKSSLVQKYNLAGAAIWEKSYAEPTAWNVLKKNLQENKSYEEWKKKNKALYGRLNKFYLCER